MTVPTEEPEVAWVVRSARHDDTEHMEGARKTLAQYTDRNMRAHFMVGLLCGAIASSGDSLSGDVLTVTKAYVAAYDEMRGA